MPAHLWLFCKQTALMNKLLLGSCVVVALIGCKPNETKSNTPISNPLPQTLESFADSMVRLDNYSLESIDVAAGYFKRLAPVDTTLADSAAVMFLRYIGTVADTTNQVLLKDTTDYFKLVYYQDKNVPQKQKQFQQHLLSNHMILQADGEGGVYVAPDYQWINQVLQPKTSPATDLYLSLLAREEMNPALLDAGLAIEMKELVDRLIASERLTNEKLPRFFSYDVAQKNKLYTGILLIGSSNSPAVDFTDMTVTEEFKKGYDYLVGAYAHSRAAKLVNEWQQVLNGRNAKKIEEWRTKYDLFL